MRHLVAESRHIRDPAHTSSPPAASGISIMLQNLIPNKAANCSGEGNGRGICFISSSVIFVLRASICSLLTVTMRLTERVFSQQPAGGKGSRCSFSHCLVLCQEKRYLLNFGVTGCCSRSRREVRRSNDYTRSSLIPCSLPMLHSEPRMAHGLPSVVGV